MVCQVGLVKWVRNRSLLQLNELLGGILASVAQNMIAYGGFNQYSKVAARGNRDEYFGDFNAKNFAFDAIAVKPVEFFTIFFRHAHELNDEA
jgi:hypothetical protein